jgi:hypothetical protein
MSVTVCVSASIGRYTRSGGGAWQYLTWALALQAMGCRVIWLEVEVRDPKTPREDLKEYLAALTHSLDLLGLAGITVGLASQDGSPFPWDDSGLYLSLDDVASEADLFLNLAYHSSPGLVGRFRRSALVDTDPGLMQKWMSTGQLAMAPHDVYFTISETVGTPQAHFPDCGLEWQYMPPPVFLPAWPMVTAPRGAPYTTVSNWWGDWIEHEGEHRSNSKRSAFLQFVDLPAHSPVPLELALTLTADESDRRERQLLEEHGWRVRALWDDDTWSPQTYQAFVQGSRGEFSCAKPFYVLLNTSWIADRTLHYLASGKPALIQYTGPSEILPMDEGTFRFRTRDEALRGLVAFEEDYARHSRRARDLAEEHFDALKVVPRVLELAL